MSRLRVCLTPRTCLLWKQRAKQQVGLPKSTLVRLATHAA
jgi:hypothetical protein